MTRAIGRRNRPADTTPALDPCSACGRHQVIWVRVKNEGTGEVGWRWRCLGCGANRVLVVRP